MEIKEVKIGVPIRVAFVKGTSEFFVHAWMDYANRTVDISDTEDREVVGDLAIFEKLVFECLDCHHSPPAINVPQDVYQQIASMRNETAARKQINMKRQNELRGA